MSIRSLRTYFADSLTLGLRLVVVALAVLDIDLIVEIAVSAWVPQTGQLFVQATPLGAFVLTRSDDARTLAAVNPFLLFTWPLFLIIVAGILLPLASRMRRLGRTLVVAFGLGAGGSMANLTANLAGGAVHNWLGFALPGHELIVYSFADLAQIIALALLVGVLGSYLLEAFWLHSHQASRS